MPVTINSIAIAAISIAITREIISEPSLPSNLFNIFINLNVIIVNANTIPTEISVTIIPYLSVEIIIVVIAPGPTSKGNAKGTAPILISLPFNSQPLINNSNDNKSNNKPQAILKFDIETPNILSNSLPNKANTNSKEDAV
jgi:hypothetical protein